MAGPQNPAIASNPIVLSKPQPAFGRTCGAAAKAFVGQIGLHAVTYPKRFPTNARKVVFAISFMKDHTATWGQPYLEKVFNGELVVFDDFLKNLRSIFFDHNHRHHAKVALRNLRQTGTVLPTHRTLTRTPTLNFEFDSLQNLTRPPHPHYQYQHPRPRP
ncbi:uncharacterized protein VP01_11659g1 [Puccinia sorghi]|uniref:Retrotransposon gag domain-containing protein n=1 Tax=Puccinia sorghi TaxID=27349 RepID=A0A0L6VSV6_9BASI|nr:uncharacterized protein VP01_11659g1 [Puccinia sorghi]